MARLRSSDRQRGAEVYLCVGTPRTWRIRVEKYPEHTEAGTGWFGGRVLWGHDQESKKAALEIAQAWVNKGALPPDAPASVPTPPSRGKYVGSHGGFAVGQQVEATLRGEIVDIRIDDEGTSAERVVLNLRGDGFYVWLAPAGTGVTMREPCCGQAATYGLTPLESECGCTKGCHCGCERCSCESP